MSLFVLMRLLESVPDRYDLAIQILSLGRAGPVYDDAVRFIQPGSKVLDVGCGTGALALRAARRGASVKAFDVNPAMLEIGRRKAIEEGVENLITWQEKGVAELDDEASHAFDVVTSGLCFSELSDDEQTFSLKHIKRILRKGGVLLVIDEARPRHWLGKLASLIIRMPLVTITYLLTQQTTHPVNGLEETMAAAGFEIESVRATALGGLLTVAARVK